MNKTITKVFRFMALMLFFEMGLLPHLSAQNAADKIDLATALQMIEKKYDAKFAYEHNLLDGKFTITKALTGRTVEEILKNILYPNNLIFLYVSENTYSIVARDASFFNAPINNPILVNHTFEGKGSHSVRGLVTDVAGAPLPYVTVSIKGTNMGVYTNDKGEYYLPTVNSNSTLLLTSIGYVSQQFIVTNQLVVNFTLLVSDKVMLNEVNVVSNGYQQISKERLTGSAVVIGSKQLEQFPSPNVIQRLEGQLPGVQVSVLSGDRTFAYGSGRTSGTVIAPNSGIRTVGSNDYDINIRGTGTLQGEKFPLVVVDGAISELDLSNINPNDIDNITFLKDAAAASIWGARAANGVIVVTTKRGKKSQAPTINFSANFMVSGRPNLDYAPTLTSAQELSYEKELVDRNFLTAVAPSNYSNASTFSYTPGTYLAQQLKAGTITQSQYDAQVSQLSGIDNRSQIKQYVMQGANSQQYNLSVGGGNDFQTYYYSASYSREEPTTQKTYGQRITTTLNNNFKLFKVATLSTSLKGTFFNYVFNPINLAAIYSNDNYGLMPYQLLKDANGNNLNFNRINPQYTSALPAVYKDWTYSFLNEQSSANNLQKDNNYVANINLRVPIFTGLNASAYYSTERSFSNVTTYSDPSTFLVRNLVNYYTYPTATTNSLGITNGGILQQINTNQSNYTVRGQLDYDHTFKSLHQVIALAGSEIRETNLGQGSSTLFGYNQQTGITNNNINFSSTPTYAYVDGTTATSYTTFNGGGYPTQIDRRRRFLSYYSNAAYIYANKYSISGSVRYDDYNNFGLDRQYRATPLWSSGLKWNISREDFLKNVSWIDNLSLRGTYGINGNLSLSTYPYTYISAAASDFTTGQNYASIIGIANPELTWEKVYTTNIGVDFSLFKNRLNGTFDVYNKRSTDLLYSFPISAVYVGNIGGGYLTRNTATMQGKGFDLGLNGVLYNSPDWTWSTGATVSYNTNKVTDTRFLPSTYSSFFGTSPTAIGPLSGYATDKLLVYRFAGLDANGLTQIYDENNNVISSATSAITSINVFKNAGRTTAPVYGGLSTTLKYKAFTLSAQTTGQFGNVFIKPTIQTYNLNSRGLKYDLSADIADRWMKPGDELTTNVPGLNGTGTTVTNSLARYKFSDINVLKGDYVRLRQVSLSYQIPAKLVNKYKIKGAQIGASVNNLGLLWTANKEGIDPDFAEYPGGNRTLPPAKSFNFNLNLNF